jgi:hypothetical protein
LLGENPARHSEQMRAQALQVGSSGKNLFPCMNDSESNAICGETATFVLAAGRFPKSDASAAPNPNLSTKTPIAGNGLLDRFAEHLILGASTRHVRY